MRKIYTYKASRIVKRFLFLPRLIGNEKRWLEIAKIEQKMVSGDDKWYWKDIKWVN